MEVQIPFDSEYNLLETYNVKQLNIYLNCYIFHQSSIYSNMKCHARKYAAVFSSIYLFIEYLDAILNRKLIKY